uniref:O-acyltransferase n=1 Tax=Anolis carolinensis TaxID=28377 RepID=A0A803T3D4_ANOCA
KKIRVLMLMPILKSHRKMSPFLLKRKVFTESKPLLDELLEVQHFRAIYNIFVAVFCIFILRAVLVDFIDTGRDLRCRLLMKSYSFLRETVPPVLQSRSNDGKMHLPQFSTYLYFLFCPTLIYRENYPRTPRVRWRYVIKNFAKFLMSLFYGSMLFKCCSIPIFSNMNKQSLTFRSFVLIVFSATLFAFYWAILIWYTFFHCWLNAFAEMMCFADRTFYKDWWNATSTSAFLRSWNVVVHDWLYCYIYQDLLWVFKSKAQSVAVLFTFIVSGAFHEYIFMMSFGFFYPLLFIFCTTNLPPIFFTEILGMPSTNIILWIRILFGVALLFSMQSLEWYARIHCPVQKVRTRGTGLHKLWSLYTRLEALP